MWVKKFKEQLQHLKDALMEEGEAKLCLSKEVEKQIKINDDLTLFGIKLKEKLDKENCRYKAEAKARMDGEETALSEIKKLTDMNMSFHEELKVKEDFSQGLENDLKEEKARIDVLEEEYVSLKDSLTKTANIKMKEAAKLADKLEKVSSHNQFLKATLK